jgi:hypothetical protein
MQRCEHCGAELENEVADLKATIQEIRAQLVATEKKVAALERTFQEPADMHYEVGELIWMMIGQ